MVRIRIQGGTCRNQIRKKQITDDPVQFFLSEFGIQFMQDLFQDLGGYISVPFLKKIYFLEQKYAKCTPTFIKQISISKFF